MTDDILLLLQNFIGNWHMYIKDTFGWKNTFEVLIIVAILMIFYQKFIKNTHSEKFVKGAVVLVFLWILSEVLIAVDLTILGVFIRSIVTLSLIIIINFKLKYAQTIARPIPVLPLVASIRVVFELILPFFKPSKIIS